MKKVLWLALSAGLVFSGPAQAKEPPTNSQSVTGKPGIDQSDPVECRKFQEIGSRLKIKRVCLTKSQWEAQARDDRMNIEPSQVARGIGPN